jgi:hypothetical protein
MEASQKRSISPEDTEVSGRDLAPGQAHMWS